MGRRVHLVLAVLVAIVLPGCGVSIPADPNDTLTDLTQGVMRVGVSPHPPWTVVTDGAEPRGVEVELVREFAAAVGTRVEWTVGGEEALMEAMERSELELVIGGLTADTPWHTKAAITKPYAEFRDPEGRRRELVMAAPMGENAYLLRLERFLLAKKPR